jgi:hypothetical protein
MEHTGMVHALQEIWRVLARGGVLLDLRPRALKMPIAIAGPQAVMPAGYLDDTDEGHADDRAADAAMAAVEQEGLFTRERDSAFDFLWYWDTADEMSAHVAEKWTDTHLSEEVLAEVRRLMARAGEGARVRVGSLMTLSRWRRKWSG